MPHLLPHFPRPAEYDHYLSGYLGGGTDLLSLDPAGKNEVANDVHGDLSNFWRCLADPGAAEHLIQVLQTTPFCRRTWESSLARLLVPEQAEWKHWCPTRRVMRAYDFFVVARQSMAGRFDRSPTFAPATTARTRGGMNEQVSAWLGAVDGLPAVSERLRRVLVENRDTTELLANWDNPRTFVFLDPPWMAETRTERQVYGHEMTAAQHEALLKRITRMGNAYVGICGRRCELYDDYLCGWDAVRVTNKTAAATGRSKRDQTMTYWHNYPEGLKRGPA